MSVECRDRSTVSSALTLPPVYLDLLSCARRMLQRAQARCWTSLLDEEVRFFRAYERVARHESRVVPAAADGREQALCDEVHRDVALHVAEARRLLLARKAELSRASSRQPQTGQDLEKPGVEACTLLF